MVTWAKAMHLGSKSGPGICTDRESSFQDPRIQAAWVTRPAWFCPISQKSRETLLSPQGRPEARGGLKVTSTGLAPGHLPRNFPQGNAFPNVCSRHSISLGHLGGGDREKKKLGGRDTKAPYPGPLQPEAQG